MTYSQTGIQVSNTKFYVDFLTFKIDKYIYVDNTFNVLYFQWYLSRNFLLLLAERMTEQDIKSKANKPVATYLWILLFSWFYGVNDKL